MIWLSWPFGTTGVLGAFGATVVVCMVWRLVGQGLTHTPVNYLRDMSATVMLTVWVPLFMAFGVLLIFHDDGSGKEFTSGAVFCLLFAVVLSDVGGYTAGVLFGKHPMVPAISPKKSWEGLAGSLLFGVSGAVVAVTFLLPGRHWWVGLPLGVLLVLTGTLGTWSNRRSSGIWGSGHGPVPAGPRRHDGPSRRAVTGGGGDVDRADRAALSRPGLPGRAPARHTGTDHEATTGVHCAASGDAAAPSRRPRRTGARHGGRRVGVAGVSGQTTGPPVLRPAAGRPGADDRSARRGARQRR